MRHPVTVSGRASAALLAFGLAAFALAGTVQAQPPAHSAPTADPITARNFVSLDYSAQGPIGGESLSVGPNRVAQIQAHNRFHHPTPSSVTVRMSPAQFRHMIVLVNAAHLGQLPAHVGRRIMDGGVVTVSVSYHDSGHQTRTVTVTGGDATLAGLSQLQEFLGDFLQAQVK